MTEERKFQGIWIPASLWLRRDLSLTEKALLLEIKSFDNDFGCVATNKRLGEALDLNPHSVSRIVKILANKGLIEVNYKDFNTFEGRVITITFDMSKPVDTPPSNVKGVATDVKGVPTNVKHSNIISNNIPLIDKSINGSENQNSEKNQEPLAKEKTRNPKQRKARPKEPKPDSKAYTDMVDFWLKVLHPDWSFDGIQGKHLKEIIRKIKELLKKGSKEVTDEAVSSAFVFICKNLPEYFKNKDLMVINSKFNEIIEDIKTNANANGSTNNQKGYNAAASSYRS